MTPASDIAISPNPPAADVGKYAAAFEDKYPGYGPRLKRLAFGTGLRNNQALAPRLDSIDLDTLNVAVDRQLDRYGTGPRWRCRRATSRSSSRPPASREAGRWWSAAGMTAPPQSCRRPCRSSDPATPPVSPGWPRERRRR